jgi:hypothetical protein
VAGRSIADCKLDLELAAVATAVVAAPAIVEVESGNRIRAVAVVDSGQDNSFQGIVPATDDLATRMEALAAAQAVDRLHLAVDSKLPAGLAIQLVVHTAYRFVRLRNWSTRNLNISDSPYPLLHKQRFGCPPIEMAGVQ